MFREEPAQLGVPHPWMPRMPSLADISLHTSEIAWAAGIFVVSLALSMAAVVFVVVRLPEHYFHLGERAPFWEDRPAWQRWLGIIAKNVAGVLLIALGIVMSLPGVPGQGLLTIFIGLILLDFPGKRAVERKIVSIPGVLRGMNRLRTRFKKPPVTLEHNESAAGALPEKEDEASPRKT